MGYKNLNYIVEIAQQRNISRAAEKLFISQSALSIYLKKMEKELGVSLFIRNNNTLTPTPEGELFVATAKEILRLEQELYAKISPSFNQLSTFGISSELGMRIFSGVFSEFQRSHPSFKVSIVDSRAELLMEKLKAGTIHFILVPSQFPVNEPELQCEMLKAEKLVFVIPPDHAQAALASRDYDNPPAVDISVFQRDKFVVCAPHTVEYAIIKRMFNDYGIKPDILCEINLTRQACQMVESGVALTIQPDFCIPRDMNILVCQPDKPYYRYMQLVYHKRRVLSKDEKQFIKSLKYAYEHWYD